MFFSIFFFFIISALFCSPPAIQPPGTSDSTSCSRLLRRSANSGRHPLGAQPLKHTPSFQGSLKTAGCLHFSTQRRADQKFWGPNTQRMTLKRPLGRGQLQQLIFPLVFSSCFLCIQRIAVAFYIHVRPDSRKAGILVAHVNTVLAESKKPIIFPGRAALS